MTENNALVVRTMTATGKPRPPVALTVARWDDDRSLVKNNPQEWELVLESLDRVGALGKMGNVASLCMRCGSVVVANSTAQREWFVENFDASCCGRVVIFRTEQV